VPDSVATALRSTRGWPGVTGSFTFNDSGDLVGKSIVGMVVRGGKFEYLASLVLAHSGDWAERAGK
jgi:hypothetical protein